MCVTMHRFGVVLDSFWDNFGVVLGRFGGRVRYDFAVVWNNFEFPLV